MTAKGRDYPSRVTCSFKGKRGQVVLDQIRTVNKSRLVQKLGVIDRRTQSRVLLVIAEMFAPENSNIGSSGWRDRAGFSIYKRRRNFIMKQMIAYCGLVCSSCPTFLATQNDDDIAREKTAALYSEKFGLNFKPNEINCDGCLSVGGKRIGYCQSCEIRKCALAKSVQNCAVCDEQPCEKLIKFHEFSQDAKNSFDTLAGKFR